MADNKELEVMHVVHRKSGASTYILNTPARNTVFHSRAGSLCCMNPTCSGVFIDGDARYKGCEHTRCVQRYMKDHPDDGSEQPVERSETGAPPVRAGVDEDVDDDYA